MERVSLLPTSLDVLNIMMLILVHYVNMVMIILILGYAISNQKCQYTEKPVT